jgi:hypothetical protein
MAKPRHFCGEGAAMTTQSKVDSVISGLEALKKRLDESLLGLEGRSEHVPMHEVVHGLITLVADQHAEITKLRQEIAALKALRGQPSGSSH